jgi:nucleotide-binding universal stress UspA family protein
MSDPQAKVLVTFDGSPIAEQAIPYGRAIAGSDGQVIILEVLPEAEPMRGLLGDTIASAEEVSEIFDTETSSELTALRDSWKPVVGDLHTQTIVGDPKEQIVKFAVENGIRYIVMASRGHGAVRRLVFGSVADAVARSSPLPVLVVHPKEDKAEPKTLTFSRLIVPLDGSELARAALPVAAELGKRLGLSVLLLHAIDPNFIASAYPGTEAYYTAELYDQLISEQEDLAQKDLVEVAAYLKQANVEASWVVMNGGPIDSIEQQVKEGDLIVMTSHGRSGLKRWVMGSTAERLIRTGPVPVLLVPAPGRDEAPEKES